MMDPPNKQPPIYALPNKINSHNSLTAEAPTKMMGFPYKVGHYTPVTPSRLEPIAPPASPRAAGVAPALPRAAPRKVALEHLDGWATRADAYPRCDPWDWWSID